MDKHAATLINYLEVVIDENGEIHYAVPSHQMFMENILKREFGEAEFKRMIMEDKEAWYDYLPWLCKHTNCVPVWNEFYYGNPNDKQLQKLQQLKETKYNGMKLSLYQGKV
jgi:hypothetical protein